MTEREWLPAETAPYKKVIWVRNSLMERPVKALRGFAPDGVVNPDASLFTSLFTNDRFFPTPGGRLVCPTQWTECSEQEELASCRADLVWSAEGKPCDANA